MHSHISVGNDTDYCQDVKRLTDEHGISTVVFPWEVTSTNPSTQLVRIERLLETAPCQVQIIYCMHGTNVSLCIISCFRHHVIGP